MADSGNNRIVRVNDMTGGGLQQVAFSVLSLNGKLTQTTSALLVDPAFINDGTDIPKPV